MARLLAASHGLYGIVVLALSGWMLARLTFAPEVVGGCCGGSFAGMFQILFGIVFALAIPQLLAASAYLRKGSSGARWMVWLSALNLLVNGATAALVLRNDGGAWALCWAPFIAINLVTLVVFRREHVARQAA